MTFRKRKHEHELTRVSQLLKVKARERDLSYSLAESLEFQRNATIDPTYWPKNPSGCCRHVSEKFKTNILVLKQSPNLIWNLGKDFENVQTYFKCSNGSDVVQIIRLCQVNAQRVVQKCQASLFPVNSSAGKKLTKKRMHLLKSIPKHLINKDFQIKSNDDCVGEGPKNSSQEPGEHPSLPTIEEIPPITSETPPPPPLEGPHPKVTIEPTPEKPDILAPAPTYLNNKLLLQREKSIATWETVMNWESMSSENIKKNIKKARLCLK